MTLDQQLQTLIAQAPADGQTPQALQTIAPILRKVAEGLPELSYYICQSPQGNWESVTLQHRQAPHRTKKVIYAYATPTQAAEKAASDLIVGEIPLIALLFQLLALEPVDSIIFVPRAPQAPSQELQRQDLQQQISQALSLPPDLA
ncbi:hypothetical protein RIF25_01935 [Thermosynechococcaceae cyanobacterium BACA0444]|uniref:Uncharacterized protein n=1 Tax=Pseudocalidococcus azoricus BACA0444 TaxID=2918990 RepID=A0AAE4JX73_9CYAN|nr:hypothetical protein [Pseudocalidococcus azoricus]MDS3859559.1 hypothetical protein [Pseudocalidococcus azoricus BACA0444]